MVTERRRFESPTGALGMLFIGLTADYLSTLKLYAMKLCYPIDEYLRWVYVNRHSVLPNFLQNLTTIYLDHCHSMGVANYTYTFVKFMKRFLRLPSIETIHLASSHPRANGRGYLPSRSSNVSKIHLRNAFVPRYPLGRMIMHSRHLREFTYTVGHPNGWLLGAGRASRIPYGDICPGTLRRALGVHRQTLRYLELDNYADVKARTRFRDPVEKEVVSLWDDAQDSDCDRAEGERDDVVKLEEWEDDGEKYNRALGPLHDFAALTHLTVGVQLLLGEHRHAKLEVLPSDEGGGEPGDCDTEETTSQPSSLRWIDILPPNLEYLCIRGYEPGDCPYCETRISDLMANKDKWFPSLKEIHGVDRFIEGTAEHACNGRWRPANDWEGPVRQRRPLPSR
jgi:hypothetical protein